MEKQKKQQILLIGSIIILIGASLAVLLWYSGFFSSVSLPYGDGARERETKPQKTIDLFSDPRFQKLHIENPKPIDIGTVGNPNPFLPFDGREPLAPKP